MTMRLIVEPIVRAALLYRSNWDHIGCLGCGPR